jgi:hypothetical protein
LIARVQAEKEVIDINAREEFKARQPIVRRQQRPHLLEFLI